MKTKEINVENSPETVKVLVVDDERDIRDGSARILKRSGFQVKTATRGDEALQMLAQEPVSILLLDLKMPGMDGMEVFERVRAMDANILVIIITGFATVETAIEAMKNGAYDFIPKPFEPDQLRIVMNRAFDKIRMMREAAKLEQERSRTLTDLDTEKSRIHTIVKSLPDGVVVTNTQGKVVLMNPAFRQLLNLDSGLKPGNTIENYVPDEGLSDLIKDISRGVHVDFDDIPDYEFKIGSDKYLLAKGQPVLGDRNECLGAVVNIHDISSMRLLDQLKSEFVAKVTHELRSPLSTIHEQLAVVIQDMMGAMPDQEQHILARAKEKTQGLIALIGDLLDLSRIEEGLICHSPNPVHLDDLLGNIIDFLKARSEAKNQTLELEISNDDMPELTADPIALESIFGNLITNAINYTQDGGEIRVKVDLAGINIRVAVIDNGFGIEPRHLERIFERFYRVKDDKTRFITGTGLGLPIVKGLVDSMNGMINVTSTPGKGTTFTVLLPV